MAVKFRRFSVDWQRMLRLGEHEAPAAHEREAGLVFLFCRLLEERALVRAAVEVRGEAGGGRDGGRGTALDPNNLPGAYYDVIEPSFDLGEG